MRFTPTSSDGAAEAAAALCTATRGRVRAIVDGPIAADPVEFAAAVARACLPRPAFVVRADHFLRAASLRLESGREDPSTWLDWLDTAALEREVLTPFASPGKFLPGLRDPGTDRSLRIDPVRAPEGSVLLLAGSGLLGRGLPCECTIRISLTPAAVQRRTTDQWLVAAQLGYADSLAGRDRADLVINWDDPLRPAFHLRAL